MKLLEILKNQQVNRESSEQVTLVCKDCGNTYYKKIGEICWHYAVGNIIPNRCSDCKSKRKELFITQAKTEKENKINI